MFYYVKLNICLFLFLLVIFSHVGAQRVATILPVLPNSGVFPYAQTETGKCTMNFDIKGDGIDFISNTFTSCTFSPATPCQFTVKEANRTHFLARSSVMYSPGTYINIQISIVLSNSTTVQYTLGDKINNSAYTMVCEAPPISPITATLSPPVLYISSYSINTFRSSSYLTLPDIIKRPITDLACESPINFFVSGSVSQEIKVVIFGSNYATTKSLYLQEPYTSLTSTSTSELFDVLPYKGNLITLSQNQYLPPIISFNMVPVYGTSLSTFKAFFLYNGELTTFTVSPTTGQVIALPTIYPAAHAPTRVLSLIQDPVSSQFSYIDLTTNSTRFSFFTQQEETFYTYYPFGLVGTDPDLKRVYRFPILNRPQQNFYSVYVGLPELLYRSTTINTVDAVLPILTGLEIIPINASVSILRLTASDVGSGVRMIIAKNQALTFILNSKNLVYGNWANGIYETFIPFKKMTPFEITVIDNAANLKTYDNSLTNYLFNLPLVDTILLHVEKNLIIATFGFTNSPPGFDNVLSVFIKETGVARDQENSIHLKQFISPMKESPLITGVYNSTTQIYSFPFKTPVKMIPGYLKYALYFNGVEVPEYKVAGLLNDNSRLKVINTGEFDYMFPVVDNVQVSTLSTINTKDSLIFDLVWDIQISDPSGIAKVLVTVSSTYDVQGKNFSMNGNGLTNINMPIIYEGNAKRCRDMDYFISYIYTEDSIGNKGETFRWSSPSLHPYYLFDNTTKDFTKVVCQPSITDTTPPTISPISLEDAGITALFKSYATLKFTLSDPSGISPEHIPVCFFNGYNNQYVSVQSTKDTAQDTYICYVEFPYSFGPVALISIYGISDNFYNLIGFSTKDLSNLGYLSQMTLPYDIISQPVIESTSSLEFSTDFLTIQGFGFGVNGSSTVQVLYDDKLSIFGPTFSSATLLTISNLPKASKYTIRVINNNKSSNQVTVNRPGSPQESSESSSSENLPPVYQCSTDCGVSQGFGKCVNGQCICNPLKSGSDCKSSTDNSTVILPNPDKPSVNVTIPGTNSGTTPEFTSFVSVVSIRELDPQNNQISNYIFNTNKWTLVKEGSSSNDQLTTIQYKYTIDNSEQTTIVSTVQVFTQATNVTFGNQQLYMNPSTIKFTFNITKYPFTQSTNSLQLVMNAGLESSERVACSYKEFINDQSNSEYLKIQIEDRSLFGRFIKFGIIDGRQQIVSNSQLDNNYGGIDILSKSTSDQSYIGLNIPFYTKQAILDPDFSVLIEQNKAGDQENSICTSISKQSLTNAQIAGIVVGGVVFLFIVGAVIIYFLSRKGSSTMAVKLRKIVNNK